MNISRRSLLAGAFATTQNVTLVFFCFALASPLVPEALGHLVGTVVLCHFFTHDHNVFVVGELFIKGFAKRVKAWVKEEPTLLLQALSVCLEFKELHVSLASGLLVYALKSRCKKIRCCGCTECERDVLALEPNQISIEPSRQLG